MKGVVLAGSLIGVGMGGFVDGILFHHILQFRPRWVVGGGRSSGRVRRAFFCADRRAGGLKGEPRAAHFWSRPVQSVMRPQPTVCFGVDLANP